MTKPRCCGGNQPTTRRPLAELLLAEQQEGRHQDQRGRRGGRERRRRGQRRADTEHEALADAVHHIPPGDQGQHHAEAGHRRDQAGPGEVQAHRLVQGGNQEGHAVDEDIGRQRREQRDDEHRPSPRGADRVDGHPIIVPRGSHHAE
jgi:hypothetical protein